MTHVEVIKKIIGEVRPVGETTTDGIRFESLKSMCDLVSSLIVEINEVSERYKDSHEYSVKRSGEYADKFITQLFT